MLERMTEQLGAGGEIDVECRLGDGVDPARSRWVRIRGQAVIDVDGAVKRVAGSITDTTDLRRSIDGLKQGQKRFAVALDNHGVGFWEWDLATDRVYRDGTWLAIHGYGEGEVSGGMAWSTLEASERLAVETALQRHLDDQSVPFDVEYRARRKDGSRIWIASRARVVEHDAAGRPSRMMGTVEDITGWKEFETQIEARNRELQTLLHVASHDLREPLRSILGFSHLLLEEHTEQLDEDGKDLLTRVGRAAERLDRLLSEISNLARLRRLDHPTETVELDDVVREAVGRLEHRINESGATVEVEGGLGLARAHPTWATQAVFNLVLNALKFVERGARPEIAIGPWKNRGDGVGVVVRDRGPGVPIEQAESIFGLFRRGVGREVEGVGAGLAIVREVAARHGGKAWVQKRSGGGSEFVITFGEPGEVSERSRPWERPVVHA
ncbi:MAG: PAS domain-containing protein [Gemmatimonadales bacterium]